ncbi:MAG: DUF177 domain-containing protein [Candidatus Omnitrophica bacterium]|nr:DUF177 domain-containing protein [Candidatus Omnitrophota bacterium]
MKIHVDSISQEGSEIEEVLDPEKISLNLEDKGISFTDSVKAMARIMKSGAEVFADISLEAPAEYTCSRCLAKFQGVLKKTFNVSYEVKQGDILDIDEDIRQELMLDYPVKLLCKDDCKGLCPNCGQNLNVGNCDCK